jgi:CheY-like chemotaxis protein
MPRVLVVEDERKVRQGLERGLRAEGYEVASAATGEEGLRQVLGQAFDCIVLDLLLPGRLHRNRGGSAMACHLVPVCNPRRPHGVCWRRDHLRVLPGLESLATRPIEALRHE